MYNITIKNIREIISNNLITLRKQHSLTQIELGKMINYSDKAISRWENGEVLPDVEILQKISEVYNVKIAYILEEHEDTELEEEKINYTKSTKIAIEIITISSIWTLVTIIFAYINTYMNIIYWQIFVWGTPITSCMIALFNKRWQKNLWLDFISNTCFLWTLLASIYLQFIDKNIFLLFTVGVPIQISLILLFIIKKKNS